MKTKEQIRQIALHTIKEESQAISGLEQFINDDFVKCVELIYHSGGRVVVTGIGKSAIIGAKIVSTFNSTGTPSVFMHAADAIHGDLGMIQKEDIIICLSKSGNTPEIKLLVPLLKMMGNKLIAIVGNLDSFLARQADYVIDTTVDHEACTNNLAPTSSTTAQLVMGDALAISLLECRGFTSGDFAKYHPGGSLGKMLYLKVEDVAAINEKPVVQLTDGIRAIIMEISSKRLGATAVLDGEKLAGIITDGDLRRMLEKETSVDKMTAANIMNPNPKTIEKSELAVNALNLMRQKNITQLLIVDNASYFGVVHLHDILREGII